MGGPRKGSDGGSQKHLLEELLAVGLPCRMLMLTGLQRRAAASQMPCLRLLGKTPANADEKKKRCAAVLEPSEVTLRAKEEQELSTQGGNLRR